MKLNDTADEEWVVYFFPLLPRWETYEESK